MGIIDNRTDPPLAGSVALASCTRAAATGANVGVDKLAAWPYRVDIRQAPARERRTATYNIVRFYKDAGIRRRVIEEAVTLAEARAHCNDPETSSSTATGKVAKARTRRVGAWFDGYEER